MTQGRFRSVATQVAVALVFLLIYSTQELRRGGVSIDRQFYIDRDLESVTKFTARPANLKRWIKLPGAQLHGLIPHGKRYRATMATPGRSFQADADFRTKRLKDLTHASAHFFYRDARGKRRHIHLSVSFHRVNRMVRASYFMRRDAPLKVMLLQQVSMARETDLAVRSMHRALVGALRPRATQ